jgi:hypothetical protein
MSSNKGCGDVSCVSDANYIVIDHGDGTQTTMLHLAQGSLDPAVACGTFVRRGQRLATTGTTGWSTGVHLHVERDQVKPNLKKTCECGADGTACAPNAVEWNLFWPSSAQPNLPVEFEEWKNASQPDNRRGLIGPSKNVDEREEIVTLEAEGRFSSLTGDWSEVATGGHRGAYKAAKASTQPTASFSLKNAVAKAGTYEVWAYLPLGNAGADAIFDVRGGAAGSVRGTTSQAMTGGAFHPVRGLEHVKLGGKGEETLTISSSSDDEGKALAVDAIVLRRVSDERPTNTKDSRLDPRKTSNDSFAPYELDAPSTRAIGGGVATREALDAATAASSRPGRRGEVTMASLVAIAGSVIAISRRKRAKA